MSDVLAEICTKKLAHIKECKAARSEVELMDAAKAADAPRGFIEALLATNDQQRVALIAEIKKVSPSKGLIRDDFDPASLAKAYELGGASCLSVLTDIPYFQGDDSYLVAARGAVGLPVLRKDFMLDPYQIIESRALGADCVLLIMAALSDDQARELEDTARELNMDVLIETHNAAEMERAIRLKSRLIGVNNRNLKTLEIDLATTEKLAPLLPPDRILVCESGLYTNADISSMTSAGAKAFLVGESLMRQNDVTEATRALIGEAPSVKTGERKPEG